MNRTIEENLSITDEEKQLEKNPTDRQVEFAKVMDIVIATRDEFLSSAEMPLEAAITRIRDEISGLLPKPTGPTGVDAIAAMAPPRLSSLEM